MSAGFAGRVAVVTGAAGDIARLAAQRLAAEGATVWAVDLAFAEPSEEAVGAGRIIRRRLDVTDSAAVAELFAEVARPDQHDLVLVSGVGSVYPLMRTSSLLSNLQRVMGGTPLVLFYPGRYDQMTLKLFGKLGLSASYEGAGKARKSEHYYRAFRLVP